MKPIQTLRGFRDQLPQTALKRQWLINKITAVFQQWGYDPLETPTLEALELFEGQIGEDEKLFYTFVDPGGRQVALRYDQTVPACRVVAQNYQQLPKPFRRYQIQPAFRAERPQKGRYREFLQCDADIFGDPTPYADAEVIALSLDIYRQIGFSHAIVLINDRSLLQDIPYPAISSIDKLDKIGPDGVIKDMETKGIDFQQANQYLQFTQNLQPNEAISIITKYLQTVGFSADWFKFEPTIARSFSYSTGPIWEVKIPGFEAGSVLGGERYDQLTEQIAGINIPATGFGLGFDRTLEAAEQFNLLPQLTTSTQILVTIFSPELLSQSLQVTQQLRQAGINTELYTDPNTKLNKQIKFANKKHIPYVLIIGQDEAKNNQVTLKNMATGQQTTTTTDQLPQLLNPQNL
jgi:histidyl-tRNA synthetase